MRNLVPPPDFQEQKLDTCPGIGVGILWVKKKVGHLKVRGGKFFVVFGVSEPKIVKQGIGKRRGMLNGNQKAVLVNIIAYIGRTGI